MKVNMIGKHKLFDQKHIPLVGEFKQLLGGAMSWITILIFVFSGLSAWNTSTMALVRDHLPWMSLGVFAIVITVGIMFAMWLEHKWAQPSVMTYWLKMFWEQGNPMRKEIEGMRKDILDTQQDIRDTKDKLDLLLRANSIILPQGKDAENK